MSNTISSISLYLARTHDSSNVYAGVGLYAPSGTLVANTSLVAYNTIPHTIDGAGWVTFSFSSPATLSATGFFSIRLYVTPYTSYDMGAIRWYGASDWAEAPGSPPYDGTEHASIAGTSPTRAYSMAVSGFTGNGATAPISDYYTQASNGIYIATYLAAGAGTGKPTTPSPADESGPGIDFSAWTFGWVDGGATDTYDLYAGSSPYALNLATTTASTSYQIPSGSVFRTALLGGEIYWRVDATAGETTVTGDIWSFDPRPSKAGTPAPADTGTDQHLGLPELGWAAGSANTATYDVYFTGSLAPVSVDQAGLSLPTPGSPLDYDATYEWRIDAKNVFGTTTGDIWSFTTISLVPPTASWASLPGKTLGPLTGGTVDVDFRWTGINNMTTTRRMTAAAMNRFWYEDL